MDTSASSTMRSPVVYPRPQVPRFRVPHPPQPQQNPGASEQSQSSPREASVEVSEPAQSSEKQGLGEDGPYVETYGDDDGVDLPDEPLKQLTSRAHRLTGDPLLDAWID